MAKKVRLHPRGQKTAVLHPASPENQAKCTPPDFCIKISRHLQKKSDDPCGQWTSFFSDVRDLKRYEKHCIV